MLKKSNTKKEIEKKMTIKKTLNQMDALINKLEAKKQEYIRMAREAKEKNLTRQKDLAFIGFNMTVKEQQRVSEMKLNLEITMQMKEISQMTSDFLGNMSTLSKDMCKLTNEKDFLKIAKDFNYAMHANEMQGELLENFMSETSSSFASGSIIPKEDKEEFEKLLITQTSNLDGISDEKIDKELEELKKKMS